MNADQHIPNDPTGNGSLSYWQAEFEAADLERRTAREADSASRHGEAAYETASRQLDQFGWPIGYDRDREDHHALSRRVHTSLDQENLVAKHLVGDPARHAAITQQTSRERQATICDRAEHARHRAQLRAGRQHKGRDELER